MNISSRGASARRDLQSEAEHAFAAAGLACRIETIHAGEDPAPAVRGAIEQGASLIIACGGDGTVSSVASAVAGTAAALGVLPLGTLNHFARDLKIPEDLEGAVAVIRAGHVRRIDAAEVNGQMFINNSSLGLYPHLVRQRERRQRLGWRKWTAFLWAALAVFRRYPFVTVRIRTGDAAELVLRTPLAFVGNNIYSTRAADLGSRARLDEGTLSVFVAHQRGRTGLLRLAFSALLGRLDRDHAIECRRATELVIETHGARVLVAGDGETRLLRSPLRYRSVPGALRVLAPE